MHTHSLLLQFGDIFSSLPSDFLSLNGLLRTGWAETQVQTHSKPQIEYLLLWFLTLYSTLLHFLLQSNVCVEHIKIVPDIYTELVVNLFNWAAFSSGVKGFISSVLSEKFWCWVLAAWACSVRIMSIMHSCCDSQWHMLLTWASSSLLNSFPQLHINTHKKMVHTLKSVSEILADSHSLFTLEALRLSCSRLGWRFTLTSILLSHWLISVVMVTQQPGQFVNRSRSSRVTEVTAPHAVGEF